MSKTLTLPIIIVVFIVAFLAFRYFYDSSKTEMTENQVETAPITNEKEAHPNPTVQPQPASKPALLQLV